MLCRIYCFLIISANVAIGLSQPPTEENAALIAQWEDKAKPLMSETAFNELKQNGMVLIDSGTKQIFAEYRGWERIPFFVTSDSVLHSFHILLEETLVRLERQNASYLKKFLDDSIATFEAGAHTAHPDELHHIPDARTKLKIILGVASVLLGEPIDSWTEDKDTQKHISTELAKIESAQETSKPTWITQPRQDFDEIDYKRFNPSGFYNTTHSLRRYFQAVKWLQSAPLWPDEDEDYMALVLLAKGLQSTYQYQSIEDLSNKTIALRGIGDLLGRKSSADFDALAELIFNPHRLRPDFDNPDPFRSPSELGISTNGPLLPLRPRITELLSNNFPLSSRSIIRSNPAEPPRSLSLTFIPEYRLIDSDIFFHSTNQNDSQLFPDGLEMATIFGSQFARSQLKKKNQHKLIEWLDKYPNLGDRTIYVQWQQTISLLATGFSEKAPDIFRSEAWQRKTCETMLASWAHMRYSASLHTETSWGAAGGGHGLPGFVEPNPRFFHTLANLCASMLDLSEKWGVFIPDSLDQAEELKILSNKIRESSTRASITDDRESKNALTSNITIAEEILLKANLMTDKLRNLSYSDAESAVTFAHAIDQLAAELGSGHRSALGDTRSEQLRDHWRSLERICRNLQVIAIKQIHGIALEEHEYSTIKYIGNKLARIEFYKQESWLDPNDDAPRIADIYSDIALNKRMHIATGRPLTLYILYPNRGIPVLCKGGVMTYYEVKTERRLDDNDWKNKLDSKNPPGRPAWTLPVF